MEQEHAKEWAQLMDQALAQVREGERGPSGYRRLFQIAVLPAFDVAASWEVFALTVAARGREHLVAPGCLGCTRRFSKIRVAPHASSSPDAR